jgi:hypothetical protein
MSPGTILVLGQKIRQLQIRPAMAMDRVHTCRRVSRAIGQACLPLLDPTEAQM